MGSLSNMLCLNSRSVEDTRRIGAALGELAAPGDVYLMVGELGAGKTSLTQGIVWGLGIKEYALSPSFVLAREYHGRLPLYHIDLYRLERLAEVSDLGLDDYLYGKGVTVVEWADRGLSALPAEYLLIEIDVVSETERSLAVTAKGGRYMQLLGKFSERFE